MRVDELVEAEAIGLLHLVGDRAVFRHPLVRPAIYSTATPGLRRDVHRAVAAVLPESSADLRAWHLSEACVGPDDDVANALGVVAESAVRVGPSRWRSPRSPAPPNSRRSTACGPRGCSAPGSRHGLLDSRGGRTPCSRRRPRWRPTARRSPKSTIFGETWLCSPDHWTRVAKCCFARQNSASRQIPTRRDAPGRCDLRMLLQCNTASAIAAADRVERLIGACRTDSRASAVRWRSG